LKVKLDIVN